jgi:predicted short-subunit dehydrogenase-like oxidoreductase (DUF2520 family)
LLLEEFFVIHQYYGTPARSSRVLPAATCPDILPAMPARPRISIVGPGRLGTALAIALSRAGYTISELICHRKPRSGSKLQLLARKIHARIATLENASLDAGVIWLCVPDREISSAAAKLAHRVRWHNKIVVHSSGALSSSELAPLRRSGAALASVHPMMTFVHNTVPSLQGVPFVLEGDAAALKVLSKIVRDLGGTSFRISPSKKAAYHAWGAFASPLVVALLIAAEKVARAAGIDAKAARRRVLPILRQTIENYGRFGAAGAFSGPLVRGDEAIVRKHLRVLRSLPAAAQVYLALSRSAVRNLPVKRRAALKRLLT